MPTPRELADRDPAAPGGALPVGGLALVDPRLGRVPSGQVVIALTPWECRVARAAGRARHAEAIQANRAPAHGAAPDAGPEEHILGAHGEEAGAAYEDRYWHGSPGEPDRFRGDVAGYQIRTRARRHYDLYIHRDDPDDQVYLLVVGPVPVMTLVGWITGAEGRRRGVWGDPYRTGRPAYWVKQWDLAPLATVPPPPPRRRGRALG